MKGGYQHLDIALTRTDMAAFGRAVAERFPDILYCSHGNRGRVLPVTKHPNQIPHPFLWGFMPPEGWKPKTRFYAPSREHVIVNPATRLEIFIVRSDWEWTNIDRMAYENPTLDHGFITAYYQFGGPDGKAFAKSIIGIAKAISTNLFKSEYPRLGVVLAERGQSSVWAGHDALRWCAGSPYHMIDGAFRPTDDWEFPDLRWYQGLEPDGPPGVTWRGGQGRVTA